MPQHNLAEYVNHDFILKLINAQNVEMADKSFRYIISTLAHWTHGTHELHRKTGFDWSPHMQKIFTYCHVKPLQSAWKNCLIIYLFIYLCTCCLWTVWFVINTLPWRKSFIAILETTFVIHIYLHLSSRGFQSHTYNCLLTFKT